MKTYKINIDHLEKQNIFKVPENYFENAEKEILAKTIQKPIFGVPENYFDSLSDKILARINQKQSISLENLPKENIFKVPDGYFEELPNLIEKRVNQNKGVFRIIRNTKFWAAAASILIMFGLAWYFIPQKSEVEIALENISKEEIQQYLNQQDLSLLEYEAETKVPKIAVDSLILENLDLNKKDIIEHLENENLEETDFEEITGS